MTAADVTSLTREVTPEMGVKKVTITTGTTLVGATDYVTLKLSDYGISNVLFVKEAVHTTDYSVIVPGVGFTTSLIESDTELKIVTTTGNDNKRRVFTVVGI